MKLMCRLIAPGAILSLVLTSSVFAQYPFGTETRLTDSDGNSWTSFPQTSNQKAVAAVGDRVHVVWADSRDGSATALLNIYTKRSDDGGRTWGPDTPITFHRGNEFAFNPVVVVQGRIVHIAWEDSSPFAFPAFNSEIFYTRSLDGGETFEPVTMLTRLRSHTTSASLVVSGSTVHLACESFAGGQDNAREIYLRRSTDFGQSWEPLMRFTQDPDDSYFPALAARGPEVHLVWAAATDSYPGAESYLYHSVTRDGGETWSQKQRITSDPARSLAPSVAISPGQFPSTVHVAWMDDRAGWQVFYQRSTDGGQTWQRERQLSRFPWSYFPFLLTQGDSVHLAYYALVNDYELHYLRSNDRGQNWGRDNLLLRQYPVAAFPSMAISNSMLHMVWTDGRHGTFSLNEEIYYRRFPVPELRR